MEINILKGSDNFSLSNSNVTVIIDVIRAFTTSEIAFSKGAKEIIMVKETVDAFSLKKVDSNLLLMGEVDALPIEGFDFDNSPWRIQQSSINLIGKTLVQRTTNGVKAVINNFNPINTFVTGFSNAYVTALYINKYRPDSVSLIASHPTSDEDLACAQYIESILVGKPIDSSIIADRIRGSHAAQKFFTGQKAFIPEDIELASKEKRANNFVMKVTETNDQLLMRQVSI